MPDAVIVDVVRTPIGRAFKGSFAGERAEDLAAFAVKTLVEKHPEVASDSYDDVIMGCGFPDNEQGYNIGRNAWLLAGLPESVPGHTLNRFCASSLQSIRSAANSIIAGDGTTYLAGGTEASSRAAGNPDFTMHPKLDGSEDSLFALRTALDLPLVEGTEITLLHVTPERELRDVPAGALGDELRAAVERRERAEGLEVLSQARALVPAGVAVRMDLERGRAADRIREVAAAAGSDLIVLGSRGAAVRGDRPMQGTTAERLLETAHCAVLVARAPARQKAKVPKREEAAVGAR